MEQFTQMPFVPSRVCAGAVSTAAQLRASLPVTGEAAALVRRTQESLARILAGHDDRLALIVGPCSIHDANAALDYAARLARMRGKHADALEIVMRVYFEKPRTTVGWKGWINDPMLDGTFRIETGLRVARRLLVDIHALGVPAATEFLDLMTVPYLDDLVSWCAIGARTTESQTHRQTASGLAAPVGFKNSTDGNVRIAIDAVEAARSAHHYLAPSDDGALEIVATRGNRSAHVVLRGGKVPNYDAPSVASACAELRRAGLPAHVVVDASHGNSGKRAQAQIGVCEDIAKRLAHGESHVAGLMLESHLVEGRQDIGPGASLVYGQSITDACLGWSDTVELVERLADAVRERRRLASGLTSGELQAAREARSEMHAAQAITH